MASIPTLTLTGVDERTDIDRLVNMARDNPFVEFGFLYTTTPEGRGRNRYPRREWLAQVLPRLSFGAALHVCGSGARQEMSAQGLLDLTVHTPRVQVNGIVGVSEIGWLATLADTLITQHTARNHALLTGILTGTPIANHCVLIDDSGGRGISPDMWSPPVTDKRVGFAGGLGPDNLAVELQRIQAVAKPGAWVDMEGKLRSDDWFDLDKAQACIDIFKAWEHSPNLSGAVVSS